MGWGHFGRSKRAQSLGSAEPEGAGGVLGSRPASIDSVSTAQAWPPLGSLTGQQWAAAAAHTGLAASPPFAHHRCAVCRSRCVPPYMIAGERCVVPITATGCSCHEWITLDRARCAGRGVSRARRHWRVALAFLYFSLTRATQACNTPGLRLFDACYSFLDCCDVSMSAWCAYAALQRKGVLPTSCPGRFRRTCLQRRCRAIVTLTAHADNLHISPGAPF